MKNMDLALIVVFTALTFSLKAGEPVCHHCEEIREYNAKHHENFEYYEDYLKSQKESEQKPQHLKKRSHRGQEMRKM